MSVRITHFCNNSGNVWIRAQLMRIKRYITKQKLFLENCAFKLTQNQRSVKKDRRTPHNIIIVFWTHIAHEGFHYFRADK